MVCPVSFFFLLLLLLLLLLLTYWLSTKFFYGWIFFDISKLFVVRLEIFNVEHRASRCWIMNNLRDSNTLQTGFDFSRSTFPVSQSPIVKRHDEKFTRHLSNTHTIFRLGNDQGQDNTLLTWDTVISRTSARDCNVLISSFSTSWVCSPISLKRKQIY